MAAPGYARGFELTLHADRLDQPLGRKKPTVYFVGSMADLFHDDVPDAFIDRVLASIRQTPSVHRSAAHPARRAAGRVLREPPRRRPTSGSA